MDIKKYKIFLFPLLFTTVVYTILWFGYRKRKPIIINDSYQYIACANNMANHRTFYAGDINKERDPFLYTLRTPIYPIFIYIVDKTHLHMNTMILLQFLLVLFNGFLLIKILDTLKISEKWKFLLLTLFFLFPAEIVYTLSIMTEIFFQTTILLFIYCNIRFFLYEKYKDLLYASLFLTAAIFTKPVMLYFSYLYFVFIIAFSLRRKKFSWIIYPIVVFIFIASWSYRNYRVTKSFHFSSAGIVNLIDRDVYGFLKLNYGDKFALSYVDSIEKESKGKENFSKAINFTKKECFKVIKGNFPGFSFFWIKGILNFFLDPGRFDFAILRGEKGRGLLSEFFRAGYKGILKSIFSHPGTVLLLFIGVSYNVFLAIMLFLFLFKKQIDLKIRVIIFIIIIYIALITGPMSASRFRLPVYPLMLFALGGTIIKDK